MSWANVASVYVNGGLELMYQLDTAMMGSRFHMEWQAMAQTPFLAPEFAMIRVGPSAQYAANWLGTEGAAMGSQLLRQPAYVMAYTRRSSRAANIWEVTWDNGIAVSQVAPWNMIFRALQTRRLVLWHPNDTSVSQTHSDLAHQGVCYNASPTRAMAASITWRSSTRSLTEC